MPGRRVGLAGRVALVARWERRRQLLGGRGALDACLVGQLVDECRHDPLGVGVEAAVLERRPARRSRTRIGTGSRRSSRGRRWLRGHTFSVPHSPHGITGACVAWASRAAPQRPFSTGSKNAGPRGIVPSGAIATASPASSTRMACSSGSFEPDDRLTRMPPAIFDQTADDRDVEDLLLAEEAERATGLAEDRRRSTGPSR